MTPWLDERLWFPDPRSAESGGRREGLVAIGGDLSPERLLLAYRHGIFPWSDSPITWWSPDPRGILEFDALHLPHSLRRRLRASSFLITSDQAFREVVAACAAPAPGRQSTWITPGLREAYHRLHVLGHAHSVECWLENRLVGGVYGVAIGGLFAGESMFHRVPDASKVALVHLVRGLKGAGFQLFDVQMVTPVTRLLGARGIPRDDYLGRLREALQASAVFPRLAAGA